MNVQEARKYLPDEEKLSDAEIERLLAEDYALAKIAVESVLRGEVVMKSS